MSESAFKEKVDRCKKENLPDLIDNAAWDHALYLFNSLLDVAADKKEKIRIISGTLNDKFYGKLLEKFKKAKRAGSEIEVLVTSPDANLDDNTFAKWVDTNGKLIHAKDESIPVPHMLVIGEQGQRFRLETDHSQTKAVASFNNPYMGEIVLDMYKNAKKMLLGREGMGSTAAMSG